LIAELRADGVSVICIPHRPGEVKSCADHVVCLRDGRVVGELARGNQSRGDDQVDDRARPEATLHPAGCRTA
jgi:ABC-type sugar transport system ATPase subunit